jgi:hypothetical protein
MSGPRTISRAPIVPERVRAIGCDGFAFVPNRFLRDGFFAELSSGERGLYFLLVLAGDRRGMSYYHYDTICSLLTMPLEDYVAARDALIAKDLIAFDGTRFQVLTLPARPVACDSPRYDSIRAEILRCLTPEPSNRG